MNFAINIMDKLERWRLANRETKAGMSAIFKTKNRQDYSNWLSRDSLPKKHWSQASKMVGSLELAPKNYEDSVFSHLTSEQKGAIALKLLPQLSGKDRAAALALLFDLDQG
jgi:hypothetical protein